MRLWLLTGRDKPGKLDVRKATRDAHRQYIYRKDLPAQMVFGSPLLDESGAMCGTWLVLMAPSLDAIQAFADGDPYRDADLFETVEIRQIHETFDWTPKVDNLRAQLDGSSAA